MKKLLTALFALALLGGLAQAKPVKPVPTTGVSVPVKALGRVPIVKNCGAFGC